MERYGGYLEAVKAVTQELKDITDSVNLTVGKVDDANYEAEARSVKAEKVEETNSNKNNYAVSSIMDKINTMQENSNAYKSDPNGNGEIASGSSNQKNLAAENERLGNEIESLMPSGYRVFRESDGIWYYKKTGTNSSPALPLYSLSEASLRRLFEIHHVGGVAGNKSTIKQDEVFALLQKGEAIFTKEQQSSLMRILDFSKAVAGKFDSIAMSGANFLTGQLKDLTGGGMTPAYAAAGNVSYDINVPVQIFPAQKMDESEIKSLTSKISDYTIKTLNDDIGRRGIRGGMKRF